MNPEVGKISGIFLGHVRHLGRDREKLCIILGAGADISSGGMTFTQLKKACLEKFKGTSYTSVLTDADLDHHFNLFLEENEGDAHRAAIVDFLFHGFETGKPSDGYKLLVLLAKEGIIDSVVTTNFDNLLEIAQRELGLDIFQIYAPGMASPFVIDQHVYLPPKPIYVKVHGDIPAQLITHITKKEIREKQYNESFSLLLRQIFLTHRIIFVGYGGSDEIFAREVEVVSDRLLRPVYWCNRVPIDLKSPLAKALQGVDVRFVRASFEEIFTEGSVPCLRGALEASVQFVAPLIRERLRKINENFLEDFPYPTQSERLELLIPRRAVTEKIAVFRANLDKPLAVLAGVSGVGKSTVLAQLCDSTTGQELSAFIAIKARSLASTDFARAIVERLGYTSENPLAVLYHFSSWLTSRNQQLTIAIDALNEFSVATNECVMLFREILRVAFWFQHHGALKVLVTIRPESWNEMYFFIDSSDLARVLWSETEFKDKVSAIHLGKFDQDELASAYNSYAKHYSVNTPLRQIDVASRDLLADPYLLALAMQNRETITSDSLDYDIYRRAHQRPLIGAFGPQKARGIEISLARLAMLGINKNVTLFALEDLDEVGLLSEQILILREINILSQRDTTTFCFSHDRVHESYLVMAICELSGVRIQDVDDLLGTLQRAANYLRLHSALRQCFAHPPQSLENHYTRLIFEALELCLSRSSVYSQQNLRLLHEFAKDTIMAIAANAPNRFCEIAQNFFDRNGGDSRNDIARLLLHACCLLTVDRCLPLMASLAKSASVLLRAEAMILFYDKVVQRLLSEPHKAQSDLTRGLFSQFFGGDDLDPCRKVLRILGLVSQIGPDNTHPAEWAEISKGLTQAFQIACEQANKTGTSFSELPDLVVANANRYLFNAGEDILEHYFMSPTRKELLPIFEEVDLGHPLELHHIERLRPYVSELGQTIEFIICNLIFVISMKTHSDKTLVAFKEYFSLFNHRTHPEEIDFFLSALCLSHLAIGKPFQEIATDYTEKIITECPQAITQNPGAARAQRRGRFIDPFDQQFEDGFNPLAFYFYNAPASQRQALGYKEYIRSSLQEEDLLPLYWKCLSRFETLHHEVGTVRVIHALGQMISLWPVEGLVSLRKLLGRTEPTVRRAIIRVLAEAYARFPGEIMLLMAQSGSAFTDEEKYAIKCGIDPRLSERSFEQLQWSRILLFLDERDPTGRFINDITGLLVRSISFPEALKAMTNRVMAVPGLPLSR